MAMNGTGSTIVFGTTAFTAEILDFDPANRERVSIETSHMGTTSSHTFMPGALVDNGELSLRVAFNPANEVPIDEPAETVTITFPVTPVTTWSFTAFVTADSPSVSFEERSEQNITLKISGDITVATV